MTTDPLPAPEVLVVIGPNAHHPQPVADADADADVDVAPYAGAVTRLAAYVVDVTAMSSLLAAGSAVVAYLVAVVTGHRLELSSDRDLAGIGLAIWWVVYFAGSWATAGSTLGMALFGLRVVRADRAPVSALAALVRALTLPLSLALFGLGFLGILFQAQRRALHDLLAGTAVVYTAGSR